VNKSKKFSALCNFVIWIATISFAVIFSSCKAPSEPGITPPQPVFVANSTPPDTIDHGIYADVGSQNAIDIEWKPDTTGNTSGYLLYRSIGDSSVGTDGLLAHRTTIANLESSNQLVAPPPTSYVDTLGIASGATYYYQLQAFYRSPSNQLTYSLPTHAGLSTSFKFAQRVSLLSPNGTDTLHGFPLQLLWNDPNDGGTYQIIVQRLDNQQYVASWTYEDFESTVTTTYPSSSIPLVPNVPYQWRVKWTQPFGGSTSAWTAFSIEP
jgi:hypothetical protein